MGRSKLLNACIVLNLVLFVTFACAITGMYLNLNHKVKKVQSFYLAIQKNPSSFAEPLTRWAMAIAGESFLGSSNGELSKFISNEFAIDAASLSHKVTGMTSFLEDKYHTNSTNCSVGSKLYCGDRTGFVSCPEKFNPPAHYCTPGRVFDCAGTSGCVDKNIESVASAVGSGARLLHNWQTVGSASNSPAAFSATVFRLDLLTKWLGEQMQTGDWQAAGQSCVAAVNQVKNIDWSGSYVGNQRLQSWEANNQVQVVANYILQICEPLTH